MNDTKQNARRALTLTTLLTLFVAGAGIFIAYANYKPGMNFLDITSYVTSNKYIYFLLLIIGNMVLLPSAILLFNVMFCLLDWHNYGYSFVMGLVWIWAYKKTGHLIAPMIAHCGGGIISFFYFLIVS